ncbi:MAG: hypothetical protein JXN64_05250 [Spirochaetes bacterium]|nr:hypothetical protein [Spirochaetota bacterium]
MKTTFIKINDISEINPSKVSVHDLNNRYIDKEGKMFGLKYNRKTRKVSIIRIIRTPAKSAEYFNQLLRTQKKEERLNHRNNSEKSAVYKSANLNEINPENEYSFDFNSFISETIELMQTHKSRISGIMMNIKNSRMIPEADKINSTELNDLFRNLEIDGIIRIDKALTDYKEIKNYPRSLTYYLSKLDSRNRRTVEELDTDSRKMTFVLAAEMYYAIKTLYRTLFKIINDLNNFINRINPGGPKDITSAERQYFIDAKISVENTITEISVLFEKLRSFEDYINDAGNF